MRSKRIIVAASVLAVALTAGVAGILSLKPGVAGQAAGYAARHIHFSGHPHGFAGGGHGHGMAFICSDRRDDGIERVVGFFEGFVDFTPPQAEAWARLTERVRAGSAAIGEVCDGFAENGAPDTAPERLARVEALMAAGLDGLRQIRPAFADFYATLSDKQKQALEDLMSHRGRRS